MGFVVDALAKICRADQVALIREPLSDVEIVRFPRQARLLSARVLARMEAADLDARVVQH